MELTQNYEKASDNSPLLFMYDYRLTWVWFYIEKN